MKRILPWTLVLCATLTSGCQMLHSNNGACTDCQPSGAYGGGMDGGAAYGGPSAPQATYPYYTTRGPRDFFADQPPSIGR